MTKWFPAGHEFEREQSAKALRLECDYGNNPGGVSWKMMQPNFVNTPLNASGSHNMHRKRTKQIAAAWIRCAEEAEWEHAKIKLAPA